MFFVIPDIDDHVVLLFIAMFDDDDDEDDIGLVVVVVDFVELFEFVISICCCHRWTPY